MRQNRERQRATERDRQKGQTEGRERRWTDRERAREKEQGNEDGEKERCRVRRRRVKAARNICDKDLTFRIDTGAKCNILVKSEYGKLHKDVKLCKSSKTLRSYSNHKIMPVGTISVPVQYKGDTADVNF